MWDFLILLGIIITFIGVGIIFLGIALKTVEKQERDTEKKEVRNTKTKGGGVILIGPIPIIFGTDRSIVIIAIIGAIILIVLSIIFFIYL